MAEPSPLLVQFLQVESVPIGYNRAASLIERMEQDGVVSSPNHKGVREVLLPDNER